MFEPDNEAQQRLRQNTVVQNLSSDVSESDVQSETKLNQHGGSLKEKRDHLTGGSNDKLDGTKHNNKVLIESVGLLFSSDPEDSSYI